MIALVALMLAADATAWVGQIHISRGVAGPTVTLRTDDGPKVLKGEMQQELAHISSAKVEVLGFMDGDAVRVKEYRILDVGRGVKPLVGTLETASNQLALRPLDEGEPIVLNARSRTKARLAARVGAKIWVHGKSLVSGELKVLRYGILREAPKVPPPDADAPQESKDNSNTSP